ncbi:MFS transporter [Candidatus Poribacteria bacterium]
MSDEKSPEVLEKQDQVHTGWNFLILALTAILKRAGWIFKTESIIMPGFVYTLTSSGAIRGILPLVSRFGRSLPQFVIAHWVNRLERKWPALFIASLVMAMAWGSLSCIIFLLPGIEARVILIVFFLIYALHWIANGSAILFEGVLHGKLVSADRRGRLLAASNTTGCFLAIVAVYFLLERWLDKGNAGYSMVFGATSILFFVSALLVLALKEPRDPSETHSRTFGSFVVSSASIISADKNFRRLIYVISMFYAFHFLFPHYAVFGMETLGLKGRNFVSFLIAQNTVNALGSLTMGYTADRRGNKHVLTMLIIAGGCVPLLAVGIAALPPSLGRRIYWLVFACIGVAPVLQRIMINYVLEICPREKHGQYLGTLNLILMIPTMASPLIGWAIDRFSFRPVFILCSIIVFCGAIMSLKLEEPRRRGSEDRM